jgi:hypothetical protein
MILTEYSEEVIKTIRRRWRVGHPIRDSFEALIETVPSGSTVFNDNKWTLSWDDTVITLKGGKYVEC